MATSRSKPFVAVTAALALMALVTLPSPARGFAPLALAPSAPPRGSTRALLGSACPSPGTTAAGARPLGKTTALPMSQGEDDETGEQRRRKQQLGAAALFLFGALYDFFVTHHGVGFWDPNYVP